MKTLTKLIEGTDCHLHEINFHGFGKKEKGFCITKPNIFTGWEHAGEAEIMVFEPEWGRLGKEWMVIIHKANDFPIEYLILWLKPNQFKKELKKYLA